MTEEAANSSSAGSLRRAELTAFLFLTVALAPAVSVALVGGYGLIIWMYQLLAGPPGT